MTGFAICHACTGSLGAHLRRGQGRRKSPVGCCGQCQSFACGLHGERERDNQQFRCVECLPAVLLFSAVAYSGSENELAKTIIERQPACSRARDGWRIKHPESFLEHHDLIKDQTGEALSDFHLLSGLDLDRPELQRPGWEKIVRDLLRIQFRLDSTPQRDLLRLAAGYIWFMYPETAPAVLPDEMQVLRSAVGDRTFDAHLDDMLVT